MIDQLQEQLAARLGGRLSPEWRDAYQVTPRHLFLPDQAWRAADGSNEKAAIDRETDPDAWLEAAYSDDIIITQVNERDTATSSCSMPYMVFGMLAHVDAHPGMKVLEIGTGTGWNAALLAARLGDEAVHTVEVDPQVADFARGNLARAGRAPVVVTGDGEIGYEPAAPYDRLIATCTVHKIPPAWVEQTRPGGVILTPWGTPLDNGALLRLTVNDDGTASGKFVDTSVFMWLRAQAPTAPDEPDDFAERAEESRANVDMEQLFDPAALFAVGLIVPDCKMSFDYNHDGMIQTVWLLAEDSWASVYQATAVRQLGKRRLWDEVESAYAWWKDSGSPEQTQFGVTVTRDGQAVWLDNPGNVVTRY